MTKRADKDLTIVIPSRNDRFFLVKLMQQLSKLPIECIELLIIDSSDVKEELPMDVMNLFLNKPYELKHVFINESYPGASRNEGVNLALGKWIAFLDTKTIPNKYWVEINNTIINREIYDGAWGKTIYEANSLYEKIIIASTFGFKKLDTVPGMIIKKKTFFQVGNFLPNLLAGEDTDWMIRLKQHPISFLDPTHTTINYSGIAFLDLKKLLAKWYRNYRACRSVHHLRDHRIVYLVFFNIFTLLVVFNWNATFANWNIESDLFIPNISKITAGVIFSAYFIFRAIFLPIMRGCSANFLFKGNLFLIFSLGFVIDCIKVAAFFPSLKSIKNSYTKILHRAQD